MWERPLALWLLFLCFFLPLGLPYVNWAKQECCLFYLRSSLRFLDLPLFCFRGLSLPCLLATAILDSCFLFLLPNTKNWLIGKDPDAGKDWRQDKKGMTGWDGWMSSLTQWTWVSVNSGSWWWTGRPGVLPSMGSQRVGHGQATVLTWTEPFFKLIYLF